jgi:hypothetical protein
MGENIPPKILLNYTPERHRGTGRPNTRWKDQLKIKNARWSNS